VPAAIAQAIRSRVQEAVASQLEADVPMSCFLSGGLDSSIVATLMQQASRQRGGESIRTVSVGFRESRFDETRYAASVAATIGSRHTRLEVDAHQDVPGTLSRLMETGLGQPFADSSILPTYHLSHAVRQLGPVALSGDGGDELFGGYDRYRALPLLQRWSWFLRCLPAGLSRRERVRRMLNAARGRDLPERYTRLVALFGPEDLAVLLPDAAGLADYAPGRMELAVPASASSERYGMARDQADYLPGDVLWKVDTAAMDVALEVRSPLLDHDVVSLANDLPTSALFAGARGKHVFRAAFAPLLPAAILQRSKQGFGVPIGAWFRQDLRPFLHETLLATSALTRSVLYTATVQRLLDEHDRGTRDHTHRLFSLLMLELWFRQSSATIE
jgi:asparagine synthase (glutamine-hydrolysing)